MPRISLVGDSDLSDQTQRTLAGIPLKQPTEYFSNRLNVVRFKLLVIACCVVITGCNRSNIEPAGLSSNGRTPTKQIVAISYPLQYLTQRITGDAIEVSFPVPPGSNPQTWRPSRESISQMQTADLIIANGTGATYANWLTTVTLPDSRIRNTASRGLALADYIAVEDVQVVHSHGPEGEHSHATMVARTWLDPAIAKKQAIYIANELKKQYANLTDDFESNLQRLVSDLDELTSLLEPIRQGNSHRVLTATHELKFFTRAAGASDRHLVWFEPPGVEQAKKDLDQAMTQSGDPKPALMLFGETEPSLELIEVMKSKNLEYLKINPLDHKPDDGDYLSAMRENIELFASAIKNANE